METRQAAGDTASADTTAHPLTPGVLAAIAVAGSLILVALIWMIFLLIRARRAHRLLLADLEHRGISVAKVDVPERDGPGSVKQRTVLRRKTLLPYNTAPGWGVLPSSSSLGQKSTLSRDSDIPPLPTLHPNDMPNKRAWSFSRRSPAPSNIRLHKVRNARLSAIIESPRTIMGSTTPPLPSSVKRKLSSRSTATEREQSRNEGTPPTRSLKRSFSEKQLTPPRDPSKIMKPSPLFSRTKKNRAEPQAGKSSLAKPTSAPDLIAPLAPLPLFSGTDGSLGISLTPQRRNRSNSVPSTIIKEVNEKPTGPLSQTRLPSFHTRQSGLAPQLPVPPLPLRPGHWRTQSNMEYSPSRRSDSSFESATSSILITGHSPHANRSPNARLKHGANHELKNALILGPRPIRPVGNSFASHGTSHGRQESIRSNVAIYTIESSNPPSRTGSMISVEKKQNLSHHKATDSIGRVGRPAQRTPSVRNHGNFNAPVVTTPQRRSQVNQMGSPADRSERKRSSVLRDVSGNLVSSTRQPSQASMQLQASSSASSMGNPFQWDPSPMKHGKPSSAAKGSPVKRAHRRQNCIKLSFTGASPTHERNSFMQNIQEEPSDATNKAGSKGDVSKGRSLPRPPSCSVFAPDIRMSPTHIQKSSQPRDSPTDFDDDVPHWRHTARLSDGSIFSIPTFPSPVRNTESASKREQEAHAPSRPTWDQGDAKSNANSTPTKPPSSHQEYDPNFPILQYYILNPSPTRARPDSPVDPLAALALSSRNPPATVRTTHQDQQAKFTFSSPACSPKTLRPVSSIPPISPLSPYSPSFDSNAHSPDRDGTPSSFHSTPVLDRTYAKSPSLTPQTSSPQQLHAHGQNTSSNNDNTDNATTTTNTIMGPRTEPARDLRKTVAQLRRMNSAAKSNSRSGRRYLQLGREASRIPVLSAKGNESNYSLPGISPCSDNDSTPTANTVTPSTYTGTPNADNTTTAALETSTTATTLDFDLGIGLGLDLGFPTNPRPQVFGHSHTYSNGASIYPRTSYDDDANSSRISLATMDTGRFGAGAGASSTYWGTANGGLHGAISLSDLILAESENMNIFAREELAAANPGTGATGGASPTRSFWGASGADSAKTGMGNRSSVWEDGEGFWGCGDGAGGSGSGSGSGSGGAADSGGGQQPRQLFSMDGDSDVENWGARRPVTPEKSQKRRGKIGGSAQPQQRGTPGSLYDGEGFLKV